MKKVFGIPATNWRTNRGRASSDQHLAAPKAFGVANPGRPQTPDCITLAAPLLTRRRFPVDLADRSAGHLATGRDKINFINFAVSAFHVHCGRGFVATEFLVFVELYGSQCEILAVQCDVKLLVLRTRDLAVEIAFHADWHGRLGCCRRSLLLPIS